MPHTIRIIGPWNARFTQGESEHTEVFRVPGEIPQKEGAYQICLTRVFNRPTGLSTDSKIDLQVSGEFGGTISIELNDHPVANCCTGECQLPIQHLLQASNHLVIKIDEHEKKPIRLDLVRLVIDESDQ